MARLLSSILILCAFYSMQSSASPLTVRAEVNPNPVLVNEAFELTIIANQRLPQRAFPNRHDFQDLSADQASVSNQTRINNGVREESTTWRISLLATEAGDYRIPAFNIAGVETEALNVSVLPESAADELERRQAFLRTELDTDSGWLNQQFIYEVRLYLAAPLQRGQLSAPNVEHAQVEQLGQDQEREELIDGQRYRVIIRTYGITPRRSGELTIAGAEFQGELQHRSQRGFGFQRGETIRTRAPQHELTVSPRPADFPGNWLPSSQVTIEERWEPERDRLDYGEPVTRTITLTAENVAAERLSLPDIPYPEDIRAYPDRGQHENFVSGGRSLARATYNQVLIPTATGELTAPAVSIPWWNTRSGELEYAELPERAIQVNEAPGDLTSPRASIEPAELTTTATQPASEHAELPLLPVPATAGVPTWWRVLAIASLVLWVLSIGLLLLRRYLNRQIKPAPGLIPPNARQALAELKIACYNNDAKAARRHLLSWQRIRQQQPGATLEGLSQDLPDPELQAQLTRLEASLYGPTDEQEWQDGKQLWLAIQQLHIHAQRGQSDKLPPLYPEAPGPRSATS